MQPRPVESPLFGNQPPPGLLDRDRDDWVARAPRVVTTLLVGKLSSDSGDENLCRVRNISSGGMMIETPHLPGLHQHVDVLLRNGEQLSGQVVWLGEDRAGVQFDREIAIDRVLGLTQPEGARRISTKPRAPRFTRECPVRLSSYGHAIPAKLRNVSQTGARLKLERDGPIGDNLTIAIPGLTPRHCAIRWMAGDEVGIAFHDFFPFGELAEWLNQHHPN